MYTVDDLIQHLQNYHDRTRVLNHKGNNVAGIRDCVSHIEIVFEGDTYRTHKDYEPFIRCQSCKSDVKEPKLCTLDTPIYCPGCQKNIDRSWWLKPMYQFDPKFNPELAKLLDIKSKEDQDNANADKRSQETQT